MTLRTFLGSLFTIPLAGCASAFVGNSPEEIKHREHPKPLDSMLQAPKNKWCFFCPKCHGVVEQELLDAPSPQGGGVCTTCNQSVWNVLGVYFISGDNLFSIVKYQ